MTKSRVHYLNMGPWPFYVGFTTEPSAFEGEMRRLGVKNAGPAISESSAHTAATTHHLSSSSGSYALVVMPKPSRKHSREQYAALVAHEATHVMQEMRDQLGELGREGEAYIVQQIVQEGLQQAWKTNRCRKTKP